MRRRGGGTFNAPADLVLLVNSAAESIYAKELSDMFRGIGHRGHINPERPLLVSLTSETDTATSGWFPRGTFLPNLFARRHYDWKGRGPANANVSQHDYLTTTPGHQKRLFTHEVVWDGASPPRSRKANRPDLRDAETCIAGNPAFEENLQHPRGMVFATSDPAAPERFEWWRIEPLPADKPTPYWIMQVPPQIIHEHSPIFTAEGRAMMAALFRITNPKSQPGPRQMSFE